MPGKNNDKNKESLRELEKQISPIQVVNNSALKPYVESFQYFPENIYQQPLGILTGFFEIKEYSEDSAYIVNFLNSVLKKEYYVNPKRPVTESLDSALHKVNVALSELAKHGNVNWLGKLDGAVCIFEKNNLHFSVAGDAKVLLCRKQAFNDISEGLASDALEPHPLKTFVNVSSGHLENKDKLLITSDDIFHILSLPQLTKNVQRFSAEQFIQFIRTALSNELEMASVIIVDAVQKKAAPRKAMAPLAPEPIQEQPVNVFSEKTFAKAASKPMLTKEEVLPLTLEENEYTDKKTGHIYVQGQTDETLEASQWQTYLTIFKEQAGDLLYESKKRLRRKGLALKKTAALLKDQAVLKIADLKKERFEEETVEDAAEAAEAPLELAELSQTARHIPISQDEEPEIQAIQKTVSPKTKPEKITLAEIKPSPAQKAPTETSPAIASENVQKIPIHQHIRSVLEDEALTKSQRKVWHQELLHATQRVIAVVSSHLTAEDFKKITPDLQKTKELFSRFNKKQRVYLALTIAGIVFIPLLAGKILNGSKEPTPIDVPSQPSLTEILAQDKNIQLSSQVAQTASLAGINSILLFENVPYAVTQTDVIPLAAGSTKNFAAPLQQGEKVLSATFMQDLKMILLLTSQKRILSFSPVSQQFKDNNINLPEGTELKFAATYLTYLYLTDPTNGQVYRYPRAEGGFGEKTDWLKSSLPLANITSLTIDDSIYYVQNNKINKLFKGQVEAINFETSRTPVTHTDIFTTIDLDNLYALDAANARVITYAKTGEIVKQYFSESFKDAASLAVSEKDSAAYVTTKDGVLKLAL